MEDAYVVALIALLALAYVGHRVECAWERHSVRCCSLRAIEGMWAGVNELGRTATIVAGWPDLARVLREWGARHPQDRPREEAHAERD